MPGKCFTPIWKYLHFCVKNEKRKRSADCERLKQSLAIIIIIIVWSLKCVYSNDSNIYYTITIVSSWGRSEAWPTLTDKGAFSVLAVASGTDPLILALIYI